MEVEQKKKKKNQQKTARVETFQLVMSEVTWEVIAGDIDRLEASRVLQADFYVLFC